jgi:hypothetical protein
LKDLGVIQETPTTLLINIQLAINMVKNLVFHSKTKHVETKYHFIRTLISNDIIMLKYFPFKDQTLDIFTKLLGKIKLAKFRDEFGICKIKL